MQTWDMPSVCYDLGRGVKGASDMRHVRVVSFGPGTIFELFIVQFL